MSIKSIGETGLAYLWSKIKSAFVSTLGTSGDYLTWTKNGTTNNITIPYSETSLKLVPIATKTYTNVTAPANNDPNGFLFYAHMIPTSANLQAYVKFRVIGTMAGVSNLVGDLTSVVEYCTYQSTMLWYQIHNGINNTSYRNWYNHCVYRATTTGITNNYGHLLGLRFYSSYNPTSATYARTITIEILETQNCTITFENSMILYANAPGTGSTNYSGRTEYDGTSQGDKHTGDNNDVNYLNREYYGARITNSALYRYMICLTKLDGSLVPINSINNNITTTKTLTTDSFDPFGEIFYWGSTTTYTAGANVGDGSWWRQIMCDLRYSFNCGGYDTTSTLTARLPLYLVAVPQSDGSAKLHSSPLSQSLPSTEDGLIYIYLGRVYLDNYPYRVILSPKHPVYWYINGGVKLYSDAYNVILENEEVVSAALNDINSRIENIVVEETDPTVPDWAKLPYKPSYNYSEVGALTEYAYVDGAGFNGSTTINRYKVCSTSASTAAKTITITSGTFYLTTGAEVTVKFTYTNTASNPTLNVNNTGARSIYYNGTNIPASALSANRVYKFVYDGSYYLLVGTLGYTKTSELTNDAGFLTSSDVTDEVGEEDKPVTASAVYEYITEDERVIASALNDLNGRITTVETDIENDGMAIAAALGDLNSNKQETLISGTNIKTINNLSILGSGNITIQGGGSGDTNVIESISVNNTALTVDANKNVNITVPTTLSSLSDDSTHRVVTDTEKSTWNGKLNALTFDGTYNASSNKAATVSTVTNAINALDGGTIGTGSTGKTITSLSQTNGNVSATFSNISITKSQVSDFPTSMTPASHTHGNISDTGTLADTAAAAAGNDYVVIRDADNSKIQTSTIKGTDVADAVSKKHSHSTITLSTTAQAYDGTHTLVLPATDPYTSARTPSAHNQASNTINVMTGYSKGSSSAAVAATDSLNTAISKLENQIDTKTSNTGTITSIKMNGTTIASSGEANLGTVITAHQDISGKADKISEVNHGTSDTTFTLTPNIMHIWGTVSSLNLTLATDSNSVLDEYMFTFTSGSTPTTLTLPNTVKWILDINIEANKTYQVSIINNLAGWLTNGMPSGGSSGGSGEANVIETIKVNGSALTPDSNKAVDITVPIESTVSGWGFTKNAGTITGITMNGASKGTSGVVNLGTVITSETSLSKGTTGGSGNAVTDISVSGHTITLTKGTTFLTSSDTIHIYSGSSAPSSGTGSNGDIYIQTS